MMDREFFSVLCFDFDGTIVDPDGNCPVDPSLLEAIADLKSRSAVWVVNTGRSLFQIMEGLQHSDFSVCPDYIIAQESELYQLGDQNRWVPIGDWNVNCEKNHRKFFRKSSRTMKRIQKYIETATEASFFPADGGKSGVVARSDEEIERICNFIETERKSVPELSYQRNSVYLRFSHINYNKGTALGELGRVLGVPPEHVFAGGDNFNDLAMLDGTYARAVACLGNAVPDVKALVASRGGYLARGPFSQGCTEAVRHFYSRALSPS